MRKYTLLILIMISLVSTTGCIFDSTHNSAVKRNNTALEGLTPAINDTVIVSYRYDEEVNHGIADMKERGYKAKGVTVRHSDFNGRTVVVYTRVN